MIELTFVWCFALCALAVRRVARLLARAMHKPGMFIRITPVSSSHLDKVIRGV